MDWLGVLMEEQGLEEGAHRSRAADLRQTQLQQLKVMPRSLFQPDIAQFQCIIATAT